MHNRRKILNIERSLGFKFERGIDRNTKESGKVPPLKALLKDIEPVKCKFVKCLPQKLRGSAEFERLCEELFVKHAPRLWPSPPVDTSDWLVNANSNPANGLYPHDLFYQIPEHREL